MNFKIKNLPKKDSNIKTVGYNKIYDRLDQVGLYFLFNNRKELVYIGKSTQLKKRIRKWRNDERIHYVAFAFVGDIVEAEMYEMWYIGNLKPKINKNYINSPIAKQDRKELEITKMYSIDSYVTIAGNPI